MTAASATIQTAYPDASVIDGMPAKTYHADPAPTPSLSSGLAKILLGKSERAAYLAHPRLNPNHVPSSESKFDLGTTAHAVLLEGDESRLVVVDADDWRTKAAREARDDAHAAGKTALLERDADGVRAMVEVARAFIAQSEFAKDWKEAKSEQTILWREEDVWLRVRCDRLTNDRKIIFDYKTTGDASPAVFSRQIPSLGYHVSDALYRRGVMALGHANPAFIFLAQETEAPYECAFYGCDPMLREIAEAQVDLAIEKWRACLNRKEWNGYGSRVHWASAPTWLEYEHAERMESGR